MFRAAWRRPAALLLAVLIVAGAAWFGFGVKRGHESGSAVPTLQTMIFPAADFPVGSVTMVESGRFYLARVSESEFRAFYWRDPHSGCVILWSPPINPGKFHDVSTGSIYAADGRKLAGPSPRHLDRFPVTVRDGEVWIDPGTLILGDDGTGGQLPARPGRWQLSIDEGTAIRKAEERLRQAPDQGRYEVSRVKLFAYADLRRMVRGNNLLNGLDRTRLRKPPDPDDTPIWAVIFERKDRIEPYTLAGFDRWVLVEGMYGIVLGANLGR